MRRSFGGGVPGHALLFLVSVASMAAGAAPAAAHYLSAVTHGDSETSSNPTVDFLEVHGEIGMAGPAMNYIVGDAQVDSATGRSQIALTGSRAGGGAFPNPMEANTQLRQVLAVEDPGGNGSIRASLVVDANGSVDTQVLGPDVEIEAQLWLGEFCRITLRERFDFDGADLPVVVSDCEELHGTVSSEGSTIIAEVHNLFDEIEVRVFLSGDLSLIPTHSGEFSADAALEVEALGGATFEPESDTFLTEVPEPGGASLAGAALAALAARYPTSRSNAAVKSARV
jgi:hypothetical protein